MVPEPPEPDTDGAQEMQPGALVPMYGGTGVTRGIQAFRSGDIILYTVRGEPDEVRELMGQLEQQGVGEVIALIRHAAPDAEAEDAPGSGQE